jgi:hypothetical protein
MKITPKLILLAICVGFSGVAISAQSKKPVETRNAALRYWIAFADMQDSPADEATLKLLEKTTSGDAAWDEAKLGDLIQRNYTAIQEMQRATKLPECDWGLEYSQGPRASIAFMMKARAMARLNTLYGLRQAAQGDSDAAVKTWMMGVRFSTDLAKGGTLIFTLVARAALLSDLAALRKAADQGSLDASARKHAAVGLNSLPETGFDWSDSWEKETFVIENGWDSILKAQDPRAMYKAITGEELPSSFRLPAPADLAAFHRFMDEIAAVLKLAPDAARPRLEQLRNGEKTLDSTLQNSIPNFERVNGNRAEVQSAREATLKALATR